MKPLADDQYEFTSVDDELSPLSAELPSEMNQESDSDLNPFADNIPVSKPAESPARSVEPWPLDDEPQQVNTRGTVAVMMIILLAGAAAVWWLQRDIVPIQTDPNDQIIEAQVNAFIQHCSNKASQPGNSEVQDVADRLVSVFSQFSDSMASKAETASINPFTQRGENAEKPSDEEENLLLQSLVSESKRLRLDGLMERSKRSTAIINGALVTVGDSVGSFTVSKIADGKVELGCEQMSFVLSITE